MLSGSLVLVFKKRFGTKVRNILKFFQEFPAAFPLMMWIDDKLFLYIAITGFIQ